MRVFALCLALCSTPALAGQWLSAVDGDTVKDGEAVYRLLGFDAPETHFARCPRERALGDAATLRLIYAIESGRTVELWLLGVRDKYHRELAQLMIDGRDMADMMVEEGFARAYRGGRRKGWCG